MPINISDELAKAIVEIASMKAPSIAKLLRNAGYQYEAGRLEHLQTLVEKELIKQSHGVSLDDAPGRVMDEKF